MDSLLQEITILPGVLGCFVYNSKQQIVGSKMPPIFKENSIKTIGNLLNRTIQIGNMAQLHFKEIEIKYNESLLVIKPLPQEALLVIICEPSANKSLISMTTGMLAGDIATAISNPMATSITPSPVRQSTPASTPQAPQAQQAQPKEAEIDEKLAPVLEQVKDALAMAIGPIAAPVMKDTIEIWAKQGATSLSTLPALATLLCVEINDDDLEKEFMAEISKITGR
jgi:hypothetical protein